jgi:hypothetical protein
MALAHLESVPIPKSTDTLPLCQARQAGQAKIKKGLFYSVD